MIDVTPASYAFSHEDSHESEVTLLRQDLANNPTDYLCHANAWLRSNADWAMEYFKIRNIRPEVKADTISGTRYLLRLYATLRHLADTKEERHP